MTGPKPEPYKTGHQPAYATFESFEPGQYLGETDLVIDEKIVAIWDQLYGQSVAHNAAPLSMSPLLLMLAFTRLVSPRPPGNLHVGQTCTVFKAPKVGQHLKGFVSCHDCEKKKNRLIVRLEVEVKDGQTSEKLIAGIATIFWAL